MYNVPRRSAFDRVFLSRDARHVSRCLVNEADVEAMLGKRGFRKVYAERLTLDEQIELFSNAHYLVALHGAGLVQQMFMPVNDAHVIEVMPISYLMPLYYWEAYALGVRYYDVVVGSMFDTNCNYTVDISSLQDAVDKMLESSHSGYVYGQTRL